MRNIKLPNDAIPYLVYQKTQYLKFADPEVLPKLKAQYGGEYYPHFVEYVSKNHRTAIEAVNTADTIAVFKEMEEHLPKTCKGILDIGCGIAGLDIVLSNHYKHKPIIHLMDRTATANKIVYGFTNNPSFYNSLEIAKELLCLNGVPLNHINVLEIPAPFPETVDLIVSTYAWCFHFPVDVYLASAYACLSNEGRLILTVRIGTEGIAQLKTVFKTVHVIATHEKDQMVLCIK